MRIFLTIFTFTWMQCQVILCKKGMRSLGFEPWSWRRHGESSYKNRNNTLKANRCPLGFQQCLALSIIHVAYDAILFPWSLAINQLCWQDYIPLDMIFVTIPHTHKRSIWALVPENQFLFHSTMKMFSLLFGMHSKNMKGVKSRLFVYKCGFK